MWTRFMDMHSGGGTKEPPWEYIYIEADEDKASVVFYNRFDHSPFRVTCTCCGEDYSLSSTETLEEATAYDRDCDWDNNGYILETARVTVEEYIKQDGILVIRAHEIKDHEWYGKIPQQGYVWV